MTSATTFFIDLAYVFLAAIAGGMLAWRLRQPIILGYVLAGILIGPFTPGPTVKDIHTVELLAEIGVILLMFSIGLEFSLKDLMRAKWAALIGGPLGILLSLLLGAAIAIPLGWPLAQGIALGAIISVASTMVLTRMLMDRGELLTEHGLLMVAITLVEDLAVVIMIILIPNLGGPVAVRFDSVMQGLLKAAIILVPALLVAYKVVPPVITWVARTQSQELFFVVILAICMGTAALSQAAGLSLALGAFVAGLIISGSEYAHTTLTQMFPLRDAFVALFFVTIGLLVDPNTLFENIQLLALIVVLVVLGKLIIWTGVVKVFGYSFWTALLVATGLTQIGEFSFILVKVALDAGIVGKEIYNATLAASLITILINAALVKYMPDFIRRIRGRVITGNGFFEKDVQGGHVIMCGYGRVGSVVGTALETFGVPYFVIEKDPDIIKALRSRGLGCLFGDPGNIHSLNKAKAQKAGLVIVTLPQPGAAESAVTNIRQLNPTVPIIARANTTKEREKLLKAGANEAVQPEFEASAAVIHLVLDILGITEDSTAAYLQRFRASMDALQVRPSTSSVPFPEIREVELTGKQFIGLSLREARIRERFGVTVVAVIRSSGEFVMNPSADVVLKSLDKLRIFGLPEQIKVFSSNMRQRSQKNSLRNL